MAGDDDRRRRWPPGSPADHHALGLALGAGAVVYVVYLATHDYPAYGAGLYLAMAEQFIAHGYALPTTVPHYTSGGVPFAYPPLGFYLAAVIRDLTGVDAITYSLYLPGVLVLTCLVPYYAVSRSVLGSPRQAGLATALFAVTPPVLQWHLSAGGIVRTLALLFVLCGAVTGLWLFRTGRTRWVALSALFFGLTVLTHPVYTVYFVLTYLLLFARYDPSPRGFVHGALVAGGGLALAAPWLVTVVRSHGIDVFTAASGTHSGLGGGVRGIDTASGASLVPPIPEVPFFIGAYSALVYALVRRRWFLPAWLVVPGYFIGKHRFQFVAGSMLTAMLIGEVVAPRIRSALGGLAVDRARLVDLGVAGLVLVAGVAVGAGFAAGALDSHQGSATQPAFVDDADREAMTWVERETDPSASFVVLGDAAEWFPLFTDRTILIGPWGVEWTTPQQYESQLSTYKSVSACHTAACVTTTLRSTDHAPEYVYVPRGHYTVRGVANWQGDGMRQSLVRSARYEVVYENRGVTIVRVVSAGG